MRTRFYFIIVTLMLMGLVLSACAADTASAQSAPNAQVRTLVVAGQGKSYLTPDIATINIGVHTEGTEVAEAVSRNTAQATKVADALKAAGIDPKDVQTSNFNIYPQQQFGPNGETVSSKYVVDNTVYVTVRDLNQLGALLDAAIKAGANQINGIQFDSTQKEKAIAEARKNAVANARTQADEMAQIAGVKLGAIQAINAYSSGPIPLFDAKGGANFFVRAACHQHLKHFLFPVGQQVVGIGKLPLLELPHVVVEQGLRDGGTEERLALKNRLDGADEIVVG